MSAAKILVLRKLGTDKTYPYTEELASRADMEQVMFDPQGGGVEAIVVQGRIEDDAREAAKFRSVHVAGMEHEKAQREAEERKARLANHVAHSVEAGQTLNPAPAPAASAPNAGIASMVSLANGMAE